MHFLTIYNRPTEKQTENECMKMNFKNVAYFCLICRINSRKTYDVSIIVIFSSLVSTRLIKNVMQSIINCFWKFIRLTSQESYIHICITGNVSIDLSSISVAIFFTGVTFPDRLKAISGFVFKPRTCRGKCHVFY